jgi:hypothetical protein
MTFSGMSEKVHGPKWSFPQCTTVMSFDKQTKAKVVHNFFCEFAGYKLKGNQPKQRMWKGV